MRRADMYFRQRVTEAEMDDIFDDAENALWNLAIDIGLLGVVTGGVITESAVPDWNVLASNPLRGYDQLGRRLYFGSQQTVDCSQDENGNPTLPGGGNERYLMLKLEFDRLLSDLRQDGNGANVYYIRDEYFEINVEMGSEATYGNAVKPDKPTDSLVLCDILILDTHTDIQTADILFDRKDAFLWTTMDKIGVTAGGWSKIDSSVTEGQAALDSVDTELILRESDGDIGQHLLPKDNTFDLGAAANVWGDGHLTDLTIYNTLKASADQKAMGTATERFNAFLYDLLIYNSLAPSADQKALGTATERFTGHLYDATIYNSLLASADGKAFGSASARFNAFVNSIAYYGALAGTHVFSAAKSVTVMLPVNTFWSPTGDWTWHATSPWLASTAGQVFIFFNLPHGVVLQSMRIRWSQASSTAALANIWRLDEDGTQTQIGGDKTMTIVDGALYWDTIDTGLAHTVDRGVQHFAVRALTNAVVAHEVRACEATYDVTDILKASLYNCS